MKNKYQRVITKLVFGSIAIVLAFIGTLFTKWKNTGKVSRYIATPIIILSIIGTSTFGYLTVTKETLTFAAEITIDATSSGVTPGSSSSSLTVSHTVGVNDDMTLVCGFGTQGTVSSVTYNSVAMTQQVNNSNRSYIYTLTSPSTGANDFVVSLSDTSYIGGGCVSIYNTEISDPIDNTATVDITASNAITANITTNSANAIVVDNVMEFSGSNTYSVGTNQTQAWNVEPTSSGREILGSYETTTTAGSVTMNWTGANSTGGADIALISIKEKQSGSSSGTVMMIGMPF